MWTHSAEWGSGPGEARLSRGHHPFRSISPREPGRPGVARAPRSGGFILRHYWGRLGRGKASGEPTETSHRPPVDALSAPRRWPTGRRWVAATVAPTTSAAPATRSAREASASVLPVVMTSSTRTQRLPRTTLCHNDFTVMDPLTLARRPRVSSPDWSSTPRVWTRAGTTRRGPLRHAPRSAATRRATPCSGTSPRSRAEARDEGAGTTRTGPRGHPR